MFNGLKLGVLVFIYLFLFRPYKLAGYPTGGLMALIAAYFFPFLNHLPILFQGIRVRQRASSFRNGNNFMQSLNGLAVLGI